MAQIMVPLYGFGGGSGGTGAILTVTAPAGATVMVSKDGKEKTKVADSSGVAVFKGLATGEWTVTITDGEQTAQKSVTITADYETAITFFSATIHVTYPAGAACTATDGVTTITAPDTSGAWDCVVPNAGTWTVSLDSGAADIVEITQEGEEQTIDKWYLYKSGNEFEAFTGGWVAAAKNYVNDQVVLAPTVTKGEAYMTVAENKYGSGGNYGTLETANTIDLTNINTLYFDIDGSGSFARIHIGAVAENEYKSSMVFYNTVVANETINRSAYAVDVSGLSGEYTIAISLYNAASDKLFTLKVYNVYAG